MTLPQRSTTRCSGCQPVRAEAESRMLTGVEELVAREGVRIGQPLRIGAGIPRGRADLRRAGRGPMRAVSSSSLVTQPLKNCFHFDNASARAATNQSRRRLWACRLGFAEHRHEQIRCTVRHFGMLRKLAHRIHKHRDLHHTGDLVEVAAARGLRLRDDVDRAKPCRQFSCPCSMGNAVAGRRRQYFSPSARSSPGRDMNASYPACDVRYIACHRCGWRRQGDIQFLQACIDLTGHAVSPLATETTPVQPDTNDYSSRFRHPERCERRASPEG